MQLLLWACLLTATVTHLVRSTGPSIIPMHNFATWFIFTEDFNPQELRNQEGILRTVDSQITRANSIRIIKLVLNNIKMK